jgi:hypothetical protein
VIPLRRESEESTICGRILELKSRFFVASFLRPVLERSEGITKCRCRDKFVIKLANRSNQLVSSLGLKRFLINLRLAPGDVKTRL